MMVYGRFVMIYDGLWQVYDDLLMVYGRFVMIYDGLWHAYDDL